MTKITRFGKPSARNVAHDLLCSFGNEDVITPENLAKIIAALETTQKDTIEACMADPVLPFSVYFYEIAAKILARFPGANQGDLRDMSNVLANERLLGVRDGICEGLDERMKLAKTSFERTPFEIGQHVRIANGGGRGCIVRGPCYIVLVRSDQGNAHWTEDAAGLSALGADSAKAEAPPTNAHPNHKARAESFLGEFHGDDLRFCRESIETLLAEQFEEVFNEGVQAAPAKNLRGTENEWLARGFDAGLKKAAEATQTLVEAAQAVIDGRVPAVSAQHLEGSTWVHSRISDSITNRLRDALKAFRK
jgi:hypothetical protein